MDLLSLIFWYPFLLVPDQPTAPLAFPVILVILFFQLLCCHLVSRWGPISPVTINKPSFVTTSGTLGSDFQRRARTKVLSGAGSFFTSKFLTAFVNEVSCWFLHEIESSSGPLGIIECQM